MTVGYAVKTAEKSTVKGWQFKEFEEFEEFEEFAACLLYTSRCV